MLASTLAFTVALAVSMLARSTATPLTIDTPYVIYMRPPIVLLGPSAASLTSNRAVAT